MIRLSLTALCQRHLTDVHSRNLSLIEMIEQISLPIAPPPGGEQMLVPLGLTLVSIWWRDEQDEPTISTRLRVRAPDGTLSQAAEQTVHFGEKRRVHVMTPVGGLPLLGDGDYAIVIERREGEAWAPAGEAWLEVSFNPPGDP